MTKEKLGEKIQELLKTDNDLDFLLGLKKEELVGRHYRDVLSIEDESNLDKASKVGMRNMEATLLRPHKPDISVLSTSVPVSLGDSNYIITSFVDISKQKIVDKITQYHPLVNEALA